MLSNEEKLLKERIRHMLQTKKVTISKIADTPTLQARYGRQINGDAAVPVSTIVLILSKFPDVSAEWLIMGKGAMLKSENVSGMRNNTKIEVRDNTAGGNINVGTAATQQILDEKNARIAELEKDKFLLQSILASMTNK